MTLKEFRELGVGLGFLNAEYGLAWQDEDAGYVELFVVDNFNHTITFNNINTKYNRKYFLAEPEKISWKYNKDTFEIEGLSKNELYKYMGVFTQGIKLVKNRIKCKKLDYDFTGVKFRPSKNRKKPRSAKPKKEKEEDELEDNWETDVLSWLTKDRIVEIMSEYPQMVSDRYKNEWYMKSVNTNDVRWIDSKRFDGIIQFMRINSQYDMRINLHICPNGQPTRVLCVPVFKNGFTKRTEFGITEEYFRILIGSFIAQDKNITVKKKS